MAMLAPELTGLLAQAAPEMLQACPDLITVLRAAETVGSAGGATFDWNNPTTIAANVPANIQNVGPSERDTFHRRGIFVSNKIFVPTGIATMLGDRIQNPDNAAQYFVVTFISDMGGEHVAFKIYVNLVQ